MYNLIDKIIIADCNAFGAIIIRGEHIGIDGDAHPENGIDIAGRERRRTRRTVDTHQLDIFVDALADLSQNGGVETGGSLPL